MRITINTDELDLLKIAISFLSANIELAQDQLDVSIPENSIEQLSQYFYDLKKKGDSI